MDKPSKSTDDQRVIFTTENGETRLEVELQHETVWLSQKQLEQLFERDQSVISRHLRNVFKAGELEEKSNMQKMHIAHSDKPITYYSLDVILSVGYRVNSKRGTQFRIWASQALKQYAPSMSAPLNWAAIQATPNTTVGAVPAVSFDMVALK